MASGELFQKAAVFGDIHFGAKGDSTTHNEDCGQFVDWFVERSQKHGVDAVIFLGDWFDNRSRLRLDTITAGNAALRKIADVAPVHMIVGNHDMYHRDNRSVHSLDAYANWSGVTVYDQPTVVDNVGFVPFLVGTEYLEVQDMEAKYLFGHFELPRFMTNNTREMGTGGTTLDGDDLEEVEWVFSGHFHKRQLQRNKRKVPIQYIGSPFGHDFSDASDNERGMMILEWGGEPQFLNYAAGPVYTKMTTTELLSLLEKDGAALDSLSNVILEIKDDMDMEFDDIAALRMAINEKVRETRILPSQTNRDVADGDAVVDDTHRGVEEIVIDHLAKIDPRGGDIQPQMLVDIFKGDV